MSFFNTILILVSGFKVNPVLSADFERSVFY